MVKFFGKSLDVEILLVVDSMQKVKFIYLLPKVYYTEIIEKLYNKLRQLCTPDVLPIKK